MPANRLFDKSLSQQDRNELFANLDQIKLKLNLINASLTHNTDLNWRNIYTSIEPLADKLDQLLIDIDYDNT